MALHSLRISATQLDIRYPSASIFVVSTSIIICATASIPLRVHRIVVREWSTLWLFMVCSSCTCLYKQHSVQIFWDSSIKPHAGTLCFTKIHFNWIWHPWFRTQIKYSPDKTHCADCQWEYDFAYLFFLKLMYVECPFSKGTFSIRQGTSST